ncbi:MAG: hypothetical protein ABI836_07585 [Gemmatimonadota bacterium]
MIPRPLQWLYRFATIGALTGILVGPQAMVAAACMDSSRTEHHQSHGKHQPAMPQHCCDLCSVACSSTALLVVPPTPSFTDGRTFLTASGFHWRNDVVVSVRFLYPLALGPPALPA